MSSDEMIEDYAKLQVKLEANSLAGIAMAASADLPRIPSGKPLPKPPHKYRKPQVGMIAHVSNNISLRRKKNKLARKSRRQNRAK